MTKDTQIDPPNSEEKPPFYTEQKTVKIKSSSQRRRKRFTWILLGIVIILVSTSAGAGFGYLNAVQLRQKELSNQITMTTATQFQLAEIDLQEGRYEMARKRYEYIIQLDPNFPGVTEKLSQVLFAMAITVTVEPTQAPTQTPEFTPTPDSRGQDELFRAAQDYMLAEDWDNAITTCEQLRKVDFTFNAIQVDGMLYIALRNRGMKKLLLDGNLEGGIYDLTLAERFGPLDVEANNFRIWARYYLTGASFWDVDWAQVVYYFSQIYPMLPNLRDGSNMTATERYRIGLTKLAEQKIKEESWCEAEEYLQNAYDISPNEMILPTITDVEGKCNQMMDEVTPES